jgi:hypothetical protein
VPPVLIRLFRGVIREGAHERLLRAGSWHSRLGVASTTTPASKLISNSTQDRSVRIVERDFHFSKLGDRAAGLELPVLADAHAAPPRRSLDQMGAPPCQAAGRHGAVYEL